MARLLAVFAVLAVAGARADFIGALHNVHDAEEALAALKVRPAPRIAAAGGSLGPGPLSIARSSPAGWLHGPPPTRTAKAITSNFALLPDDNLIARRLMLALTVTTPH